MNDIKQRITAELDCRIRRLEDHQNDKIITTGNQYEELNQALSKVISKPLMCELQNLKEFVEKL